MNIIRSVWFLAIMALVMNFVSTGISYHLHRDDFKAAPEKKRHVTQYVKPWSFDSREMGKAFLSLQEAREELDLREQGIAARDARNKSELEELERIRGQLEDMRQKISTYIIQIEETEAKNLKNLVTVYSEMSPKAIVSIFEETDELKVIKIIALMKSDIVTAIFEYMVKNDDAEGTMAQQVALMSEKLLRYHSQKK